MVEARVEKYLRDEVKKIGGLAYKFVSPGNSGVPDRIIFLPGGRLYLVELKRPGRTKLDSLQRAQQIRLENRGFECKVINSKAAVDEFIRSVSNEEV